MDRRAFLTTSALACTGAIASHGLVNASIEPMEIEPMEIIDCHTHFYDRNALKVYRGLTREVRFIVRYCQKTCDSWSSTNLSRGR